MAVGVGTGNVGYARVRREGCKRIHPRFRGDERDGNVTFWPSEIFAEKHDAVCRYFRRRNSVRHSEGALVE